VLARQDVEFDPPLPAAKQDAISRINAGHISKVVLVLDDVYWPQDLCFLWTPGTTQLWWRPGQGQENEAPVITAFFGGSSAASLEGASEAEAIEMATGELEAALGRALSGHVRAGRYIAWGAEPFTHMGYSSLPPGGEGLRDALAAPAGALFFAGEATNAANPATVHGAIETGRRAAAEVHSRQASERLM
jgi:monoamine oxidase